MKLRKVESNLDRVQSGGILWRISSSSVEALQNYVTSARGKRNIPDQNCWAFSMI